MSNLTDLLPAGAGGKQVSFVASGTVGNGVTVALNSDGTVGVISSVSQALGSPAVFESASSEYVRAIYDSNANKVVITYQDAGNSEYGTAVVGTVSGTSISFGTPVVFFSGTIYWIGSTYDPTANKVVIAYAGASFAGTALVATVSGTSISFGTPVVYETGMSFNNTPVYDLTNNKVVIAYVDITNPGGQYGTAVVGTVSGTSISFGTPVVYESANTIWVAATYDSSNSKVVIVYGDNGAGGDGTAIVGTVSGTSISFGSPVVYESVAASYNAITYDSANNKIVIAYRDQNNSFYGTAIVGTVSGTSISFGTPVVYSSVDTPSNGIEFDSNARKVVVTYRGASNYGYLRVGAISGTSISFEAAVLFESSNTAYTWPTFDSNSNKVVVAYQDTGNSSYGTSVVFQNASSNTTSFIGISDAAISDTASGSVTIKGGISTNVTGLTANSTYYVQTNGTLSTTVSSVLAGKALSSTSINLDYTT